VKYVEIEEALRLPGLRLVLTAGVPGPWGEAAKAIFHAKGLIYTPARQVPGEKTELLLRATGQTGAPVALYGEERPRSGWAEILFLAEHLAPDPPLIPRDAGERALMLGLAHEICGEQGLGWSRRLMMFARGLPRDARPEPGSLPWKYGRDDPAALAGATARVGEILALLAAQLRLQKQARRLFLVGERLSALDLYWATFSNMVKPLPRDLCPMPDWMRPLYDLAGFPGGAAPDAALIEHRDRIYRDFLPLPLDF
jgi:glutathione S-transferase